MSNILKCRVDRGNLPKLVVKAKNTTKLLQFQLANNSFEMEVQDSINEPPKLYKGMTEGSSYHATGVQSLFLSHHSHTIHGEVSRSIYLCMAGSLQMPKLAVIFVSEFIIFA